MLNLALADEPPSAMVQQAFSIPYDAYQVELWQHLMIGTVCGADPIVDKPDWWDGLPVPGEVSDITALPAVAAALGASPTQLFSEMRTTSLSVDEVISAYTDAMSEAGFQQFDAPPALPIEDTAQGAYVDFGGRALLVVAIGPKAFDDRSLQSAKVEVPPNTTVVWLIAVPI